MPIKEKRGAGATSQTNSNTERSLAEVMFDKIGTGKEHAVYVSHRNNNDVTARAFRDLVAVARRNGDVIINDGDGVGYYRPNMDRPEECDAAKRYIRSLESKAMKILDSAQSMNETLGGRYMNIGG